MSDETIHIVSGLPRSGTSLMMQMLQAGGLPALTDHVRVQDEDNPKGYFELEAVKRTKQDSSWLDAAAGRVVKMVHLLLYDLPSDRAYRVIFMRRKLREVVRSQSRMLDRRGSHGADLSDDQLIKAYEGQLRKIERWLFEQPNFEMLHVDYNRLLEDSAPVVDTVRDFLGGRLDADAMRVQIDQSLYRQRC